MNATRSATNLVDEGPDSRRGAVKLQGKNIQGKISFRVAKVKKDYGPCEH